jgi:hypothetical protein
VRHAWLAALAGVLLAAANAAAAAQPQLTRDAAVYRLVMGDGADSVRVQGTSGPPPKSAVLEIVPAGADAVPWTVGPANCTQDVHSYAVSCTSDLAPLRIEAGGGADAVSGAGSPVALVVDGGAGRDYLTGGPGDDTFAVRDGEVDIVDCGPGQDSVVADADDALYGCERVDLPAPPPAPTPPAPPAPSPPVATPAPAAVTPAPAATLPESSIPSRIPGVLSYRLTRGRTFARFARLAVRGLPVGATAQVRCRGRGCPHRRLTVRGTEASFTAALRGSRLRRGAVLELRLTAPGFVGRVVRFTVGRTRVRSATLCLLPGAKAPSGC